MSIASVHVPRGSFRALSGLSPLGITLLMSMGLMGGGSAFAQTPLAPPVGGADYQLQADFNASGVIDELISNAGWFRLVNQVDVYSASNMGEGYAQFPIPFLKGKAFADGFRLSIAARGTDYASSGGVQTWKGGFNWQVNPEFRLQGSRSRDVRAPNLQDVLTTGRQSKGALIGTLSGRPLTSIPSRVFGNLNLTPEIAKTIIGGFTYEPAWLTGFSFAATYYDVKIKDANATIGGNAAVEQCYQSGQSSPVCDLVTRDPVTNFVVSSRTSPANLTEAQTRGIDFESSYRLPPHSRFDGEAVVRAIVGYRIKNVVMSPFVTPSIDMGGERRNPHIRGTVQALYSRQSIRGFLQGRYIGKQLRGDGRALGTQSSFTRISPALYLDGQVGYAFMENKEIYVNVQNILDRAPSYTADATPLPTGTGLYDQIGRMWRVGARFAF